MKLTRERRDAVWAAAYVWFLNVNHRFSTPGDISAPFVRKDAAKHADGMLYQLENHTDETE